MYVNRKAKLCYLASPRTASRAVRNALKQPTHGFYQEGAHHDGPREGLDVQGYTCFTVVRNHWDAVVSWWYNARMYEKEEKPSLEWLALQFARNRGYYWPGKLFWFRDVPNIILLRYENLEDELNHLLQARGLKPVVLPKFGVSEKREGRHYSTYYDPDTREFVKWCFLPEINELGYKFEEQPKWEKTQRVRP